MGSGERFGTWAQAVTSTSAGTNTELRTRERAGSLMGECITTKTQALRTSLARCHAFVFFKHEDEGAAPLLAQRLLTLD